MLIARRATRCLAMCSCRAYRAFTADDRTLCCASTGHRIDRAVRETDIISIIGDSNTLTCDDAKSVHIMSVMRTMAEYRPASPAVGWLALERVVAGQAVEDSRMMEAWPVCRRCSSRMSISARRWLTT